MKAVIDIETGGFDKEKHAICEIGYLIINNNDEIIKERSFFIEPYGKEYTEGAEKIHGITKDELIIKGIDPVFVSEFITSELERFDVRTLIGHNFRKFDFPKIQKFFNEFHFELDEDQFEIIDTLEFARSEAKELKIKRSNSLTDLCEDLGFDTSGAHDAIFDCYLTLNLYKTQQ